MNVPGPGQYVQPTVFSSTKKDDKLGKSKRTGPLDEAEKNCVPAPGSYDYRTSFRALSSPRDNPGFKMGKVRSPTQNSVKQQEGVGTTPAPGFYTSQATNTSFRALGGQSRFPGAIMGRAGLEEPGRPHPNEVPFLAEERKR
jgi:hypothetical protein